MKAISLWQPWASAIAVKAKRIETRHWYTDYRGPLAIHAAKRCRKGELIEFSSQRNWRGVLSPLMPGTDGQRPLWEVLPFGAIVAVVRLAACRPTAQFTREDLDTLRFAAADVRQSYPWSERLLGDFGPMRFGWVLEDVRPLGRPLSYPGAQGLFEVPDEVITLTTEGQGCAG